MNTKQSLKAYVKYLRERLVLLKLTGRKDSNECKYCEELLYTVRAWGREHVICYQHLTGRIKMEEAARFFGMPVRTTARRLREQQQFLIKEITLAEERLAIKYPFEPLTIQIGTKNR